MIVCCSLPYSEVTKIEVHKFVFCPKLYTYVEILKTNIFVEREYGSLHISPTDTLTKNFQHLPLHTEQKSSHKDFSPVSTECISEEFSEDGVSVGHHFALGSFPCRDLSQGWYDISEGRERLINIGTLFKTVTSRPCALGTFGT